MLESQHWEEALEELVSLNPSWRDRVTAMRDLYGNSPRRLALMLMAYPLQSGDHMAMPILSELADDFMPAGRESVCSVCGESWVIAYPGQPFCSNECASKARGVVESPAKSVGVNDNEASVRAMRQAQAARLGQAGPAELEFAAESSFRQRRTRNSQ